MADTTFLALLLHGILQLLHGLCQELGEDTCGHMRQHAQQLSQPLTRWLQDMERSALAWGDLLFAALQHWQVLAGVLAGVGVLILIFRLCQRLSKRSRQPASSDDEESSSSSSSTEGDDQQREGEGSGDCERRLFGSFAKRIRSSVQRLAYRSREVEELVGDLLAVLQDRLSNSFFPVLQPAIGVGSAFEGWSPRGRHAVYRLLVPLKPPRGHVFHLELGTVAEMPAKDCRVRVELACTCRRDKLVENIPFYIHHPHEEELRRNPSASLLGTLCTGSYLDVHKTAQWLQNLVSSAWQEMPQARRYSMKVLPSSRSCKLQLTNASGKSLLVDIVFGVQRGDSDIFLSSQETTEAILTPSTTWAESYAVAEVKFFRHVARQAPHDTSHLKCLQLFAAILLGTGFSTSTVKTVAMHLLNTLPASSWSRRECLMRLQDMLWYLRGCLHDKCLNHFFVGNDNMPEDISLPPALQTAEPLNLFQRLRHDPAAHAKAMREADELQDRLSSLLFSGHRKSSSRTELS